MTNPDDRATDPETTGLTGTTPIEVEPDQDGVAGFASPATVTWTAKPDSTYRIEAGWRRQNASETRDGGSLHVITAAARTSAVGLVAAYEGADDASGEPPGGLRDGMAIRVVSRLDKHEVAVPALRSDGEQVDGPASTLLLRYLSAAAVTNPRAQLGVVLPDDWNTMTGGSAGYTANGLEHEVNTLESLGLKIRHRLYVAATPSTMAVHFGNLCERIDLYAAARDVLRAGGMVQVEAGATTALDALASVGVPPWAGYVARFDMTIVVPCAPVDTTPYSAPYSGTDLVATLARDVVHRAGGPAVANNGWVGTMTLALVDVHKLVPGVADWTTENWGHRDGERWPAMVEAQQLIDAVQDACDGEVDVGLVGTGPGTIIDLR